MILAKIGLARGILLRWLGLFFIASSLIACGGGDEETQDKTWIIAVYGMREDVNSPIRFQPQALAAILRLNIPIFATGCAVAMDPLNAFGTFSINRFLILNSDVPKALALGFRDRNAWESGKSVFDLGENNCFSYALPFFPPP